MQSRTHTCNELRLNHVGQEVRLAIRESMVFEDDGLLEDILKIRT